jgi:Arm DNA-binding domain
MSTQGKRRSRGEGGLHFDSRSQRWIATVTVGYDGRGKRRNRTASGKTKTEAKEKLKEMLRDLDDGLGIAPHSYTVANAVEDWLTYGLSGRDKATVEKLSILARTHVIPALGARKLRELTADNVDRWLSAESKSVSTRTLQDLPVDSEACDYPCPGQGQSEAERSPAVRTAQGPDRAAVEVAEL